MNLSLLTIIAYAATITCLILLIIGFGAPAGLIGLIVMGLSFFVGATTKGTTKK